MKIPEEPSQLYKDITSYALHLARKHFKWTREAANNFYAARYQKHMEELPGFDKLSDDSKLLILAEDILELTYWNTPEPDTTNRLVI